MTARAVLAAWIAVAALLAAAAAALMVAAGPPPPLFHGAPVAVIGSSLLHNAVPNRMDDAGGLLGDGRPHWRVGITAVTEDDTAALLAHAVDEHAQVALVEANVLLFDFARNRASGRCDQPAAELRRALKGLQRDLTDRYAQLFGRAGELDEFPDTPEFGGVGTPAPERLRGIYPLVLRGPCHLDALESLASRAQAKGTAIVLLVPPRSITGQRLLGPFQSHMLAARAQILADMLGAAVFIADSPWPDAQFVDGEHLNAAGRAHFVSALRHWWTTRG